MPRIPVYNQQTTPQARVGPGGIPDTSQSFRALGGAAADIQQLGAARLASDMRKREQDAASWATVTLARAGADAVTSLDQHQQEAAPGAPDFTSTYIRWFDEYAEKATAGAPTPTAKRFLTEQLAVKRAELEQKAKLFEAQEGVANRVRQLEEAVDLSAISVRADPDQFLPSLAEFRAGVQATGLSAGDQSKALDQGRQALATAAVRSLIDQDPRKVLERLRSAPGESGSSAIEALNSTSRELAIGEAETEIRRLEAEERARRAEARARATAQSQYLRERVTESLDQYKLGFGLPDDFGDVKSQVLSLPADDPRRLGMLRSLSVLDALNESGYLAMSPREQRDYATGLEVNIRDQGANPAAIEMLGTAKAIQAETERRADADPFRFAIERGVIAPPPATGDAEADLKARAEAGRVASAYLGRPVPGFTGEELESLATRYEQASPTDRLSLLAQVQATHGEEQAAAVFAELDKKGHRVMGLAGVLTADNPDAARYAVRGQAALKEQPDILPDKKVLAPELIERLGDAYGAGTAARRTVEDTIRAVYAGMAAADGDVTGEYNDDRLEAAIDMVTGGLIEFRGHMMPAPERGVTNRQFSSWADSIGADRFKGVAGLTPEQAADAYSRDGWLQPVGPNQYAIAIEGPDGRPRLLLGEDNAPLTIQYEETRIEAPEESRFTLGAPP